MPRIDIEGPFVDWAREALGARPFVVVKVDCWMEAIRRSLWSATAEVEREEGREGRPRRLMGFVLAGREEVWMSLVRRMLTLGDVPVELVRC